MNRQETCSGFHGYILGIDGLQDTTKRGRDELALEAKIQAGLINNNPINLYKPGLVRLEAKFTNLDRQKRRDN